MKVVAKERISDNLSLHVVTGENEALTEKLHNTVYLDDGYYAYFAHYKNMYLPTSVFGLDGEEGDDGKEDMVHTMRSSADWHRANPDKIGNTSIHKVDQLIADGEIYSEETCNDFNL